MRTLPAVRRLPDGVAAREYGERGAQAYRQDGMTRRSGKQQWLRHDAIGCVAVAPMGVLFIVAYVKQNRAVTRGVRANMSVDTAEHIRFLSRSANG